MSLLKDKIELSLEEAELEAGKKFTLLSSTNKWAFIIAVVGIIPGYFLAKTISHSYWSHKYQPLLVTAKPAFNSAQDPRLQQIAVSRQSDGSYSVVAVIVNDNLDLDLNNQDYQFSIFDQNNNQITPDNQAMLSGKTFLLPGQTKYLIVPKIVTASQLTKAALAFPGQLHWQKRLSIPTVNLTFTTPSVFNQLAPPTLVTQGDVVNNSPYVLNQITINLVLLDNANQILGASVRNEFSLKPHERRTYKQLWPTVPAQNIAKVLVVPETNPFDPANLTQQFPQ